MCIILGNVSSSYVTYAAPVETQEELAQYKLAITSRISEIETNLANTYSNFNNQAGLLFYMYNLSEYMMYYQHAYRNAGDLGFSTTELDYYKDRIIQYCELFNNQYSENTDYFKGVKLQLSSIEVNTTENFLNDCNRCLMETIPNYYDSVLADLKAKMPSNESEKEQHLSKNGQVLANLYKGIIIYQDVPIALGNITPLQEGATARPIYSIDGSGNNDAINAKITATVTTYEELLQYGKKYAQKVDNVSLDINPEDDIVTMFTNIELDANGEYVYPETVTLKQSYIAMLTTSSVYTPLVSYAGSPEYVNALASLASDDKQASNLIKAYNNAKDYRKPLYKRTVASNGSVTGVAELITIEEFIEDIQEGSAGALVTVQGDFHYNTEAGSWIYSQNELTYDYSIGTTVKEGETQTDTEEVPTESTTETTTEVPTAIDDLNMFNVVETQADTDNTVDLTSHSTMVKTLENVIFLGDSRTVGLKAAFLTKDVDEAYLTDNNVYFVADTGVGLEWMKSTGIPKVNEILAASDSTYTIIINLGVNDLANSKDYVEQINTLAAGDWSSHNVVYQSIGAVDESKARDNGYSVTNKDIDTFNTYLASQLSQKVNYVDVTTEMKNSANDGLGDSYSSTDGVHYSNDTYLSLCDKVLQKSVAIKQPGQGTANKENTEEVTEEELTEATTETNDTELVSDDLENAIYAYDTITDETFLTQPVLFYGTKYKRSIDNTTTAILQNIFNNSVNLDSIEDKGSRYLYINVFGDIVTDDNLIILPGFCNPLIYNNQTAYNPYSVGFMNSYPNITNRGLYFQISSENAIGKYVLLSQNTSEDLSSATLSWALITSNNDIAETNLYMSKDIEDIFYTNTVEENSILTGQRCVFGSYSTWKSSELSNYNVVMQSFNPVIDERLLFPYNVKDDVNYVIAKAIAQNAYNYVAYDKDSNVYSNTLTLNNNYIAHNFVISGSFGNKNPKGYSDDNFLEYKNLAQEKFAQFNEQVINLSDKFIAELSGTTGVLGMNASLEDSILGKFVQITKENFLILAIIILLVLVIAFMKYHRDLFEILILSGLSMLTVFLFVFIIPTYLPMCFNFLIDYTSEETAFKVLGMNTDKASVESTYLLQTDEDGNYKYNSTSITLYKVDLKDLDMFYSNSGITMSDVTAGNTEIINQEAGVFIEGDSIKVNTNILFDNLPIAGYYTTVNGSYCWQIKASKTVSNNMDYYTPYYYFVDNFIIKLNTLAQVYDLPRTTNVYSTGQIKDNYLVYTYVHSPVFVSPGQYGTVLQEDAETYMNDYESYVTESKELEAHLTAMFGSNTDWLGVAPVFTDLSEDDKKTLWAQTMQQNGYYDENWNPNVEKINKLIVYINEQTRDFIYDMEDNIGSLSDETVIKLISLRALLAFNQEVSQFGHWLYPYSLDYSEITIGELLNAVFMSNYQKYVAMDMSIAEYIGAEHGWFILILFDLLVLMMFLTTNLVKVMVPVLYILLMLILFIRFISIGDIKVPIKGYLKTSGSLVIAYTIFNLTFWFVEKVESVPVKIIIALAISTLVLYVTINAILAVFMNVLDFGDKEISAKITAVGDKLKIGDMFNKIRFNTINLQQNKNRVSNLNRNRQTTSRYGFDSSVNSIYNDRRLN